MHRSILLIDDAAKMPKLPFLCVLLERIFFREQKKMKFSDSEFFVNVKTITSSFDINSYLILSAAYKWSGCSQLVE
jgi:hypothetical protein